MIAFLYTTSTTNYFAMTPLEEKTYNDYTILILHEIHYLYYIITRIIWIMHYSYYYYLYFIYRLK